MSSLNRRHRSSNHQKLGSGEQQFVRKPPGNPEDSEFNELLPYGGQVYLGRTKKPEGWMCIAFLVVCLFACLVLLYFCYFHFHWFHFHVTHAYAQLGHVHAQHVVGERLLHGKGVPKDQVIELQFSMCAILFSGKYCLQELAMKWFRKAADQGHPHASYNLAIGHLTGIRTDVYPGEVHDLIR